MKTDEVLAFDAVRFDTGSDHVSSVADVSFDLVPGEVLLVKLDDEKEPAPILDMALGLLPPNAGHIRFMGKVWPELGAFEAAACRGQIGAVFETSSWLSSLSVAENVMLRLRHHTLRSDGSIREQAETLAQLGGLSSLSDLRPDRLRRRHLRVHEWVRACMGDPKLLLMACPERDAASDALTHLIDLVERAASRGTAVMWLTTSDAVWSHERLCGARRCSIEQERWISLRGRNNNEA
jgi:phospholipid/cholesterol/gamma-HCH transport system ATP-binding protein